MPERTELLVDAFRPEYEMDDPALFAGRAPQIEEIARALAGERDYAASFWAGAIPSASHSSWEVGMPYS